jgi:LuxR family maltose regulon positive regulatory protein
MALGWLIQAWLVEAIARDALGDTAAAEAALERALGLAAPSDVLVPFLFHRAPELLKRLVRHHTAHAALISRILHLFAYGAEPGEYSKAGNPPVPGGSPEGPLVQAITEPLSQGELRVLRYLPSDLSVQEIASELTLSVNTIRTHMRHIYDKLQAHRRKDVVAQARALGLLTSR